MRTTSFWAPNQPYISRRRVDFEVDNSAVTLQVSVHTKEKPENCVLGNIKIRYQKDNLIGVQIRIGLRIGAIANKIGGLMDRSID